MKNLNRLLRQPIVRYTGREPTKRCAPPRPKKRQAKRKTRESSDSEDEKEEVLLSEDDDDDGDTGRRRDKGKRRKDDVVSLSQSRGQAIGSDTGAAERGAVVGGRDAVVAGRGAVVAGRGAVVAGRDALVAGREAVVAGHDAGVAGGDKRVAEEVDSDSSSPNLRPRTNESAGKSDTAGGTTAEVVGAAGGGNYVRDENANAFDDDAEDDDDIPLSELFEREPKIPDSWGCQLENIKVGQFVVMEADYESVNKRGICVSQVDLLFVDYFLCLNMF
jgi:hypothetical protein